MQKQHTVSFLHAFEGIVYAIRTQPNFLVHLGVSVVVVISGLYLGLSNLEWTILALVIALGLAIELINTAVESAVDVATTQFHPIAKIAKDTAAAAMLVYAAGSIIIGLIIFTPKFMTYLGFRF